MLQKMYPPNAVRLIDYSPRLIRINTGLASLYQLIKLHVSGCLVPNELNLLIKNGCHAN